MTPVLRIDASWGRSWRELDGARVERLGERDVRGAELVRILDGDGTGRTVWAMPHEVIDEEERE